jgi:hypothetical protein
LANSFGTLDFNNKETQQPVRSDETTNAGVESSGASYGNTGMADSRVPKDDSRVLKQPVPPSQQLIPLAPSDAATGMDSGVLKQPVPPSQQLIPLALEDADTGMDSGALKQPVPPTPSDADAIMEDAVTSVNDSRILKQLVAPSQIPVDAQVPKARPRKRKASISMENVEPLHPRVLVVPSRFKDNGYQAPKKGMWGRKNVMSVMS